MLRRVLLFIPFAILLATAGCKVNRGNGEAKPENTATGNNPDNQKNNVPQKGTGGPGKDQTGSQPAPAQTPSQPASKTDTSR